MADSTQTIFNSAKRFFAGTLLSRISGFIRDMSMAMAFGTHESIAAFLVAFRLAHLFRRLLGEGALQSAFIPYFEKLRADQEEQAAYFFRDLIFILSILLFGIIFLGTYFIGQLSHDYPAFDPEVLSYTKWMLPSLFFICLFGINASLLQCEKSYFLPGIAPVAFNVTWSMAVFFLWKLPMDEAMYKLCWVVSIACFAQWLVTAPSVWKIFKRLKGKALFAKPISFKSLKYFVKPLLLGIIGISATQINSAVDALFARLADPEGPAYLWYALRLQQLPLALFGVAISGALLPPLARAIKSKNRMQFKLFLSEALDANHLLMIPITFFCCLVGNELIRAIYERGEFDLQSVKGTVACFYAYTLGLVPMTSVLILAPSFYAQDNFKATTIASLASLISNLLLNFLLICYFKQGAFSIALATSISAWLNMFYLIYLLKKNDDISFFSQMHLVGVLVIYSAFAYFTSYLIESFLIQKNVMLLFFIKSGAFFISYIALMQFAPLKLRDYYQKYFSLDPDCYPPNLN